MKKHVGVLEQAGLVTTEKVGRVRTCRLGLRRLDEEAAWIEGRRQIWNARFDALAEVVEALKRKEKTDGRESGCGRTTVERKSERELVVMRTFDAPVRLVFEAWTKPELFKLWWAPKSSPAPLISCEMEVRAGGGYRLAFGKDAANSFAFFGKYLEVSPPSRLVWTNEERDTGAVTTVTFEEEDGRTLLVLQERYPSKEALEEAFVGTEDAMPEQFEQLDELLVALKAKV